MKVNKTVHIWGALFFTMLLVLSFGNQVTGNGVLNSNSTVEPNDEVNINKIDVNYFELSIEVDSCAEVDEEIGMGLRIDYNVEVATTLDYWVYIVDWELETTTLIHTGSENFAVMANYMIIYKTHTFTHAGDYEIIFNATDTYDEIDYETWEYIEVYDSFFDIFLYMPKSSMIYEEVYIWFDVYSNYCEDREVSIEITLENTEGNKTSLFSESTLLSYYYNWENILRFNTTGMYVLEIVLIDNVTAKEYNATCSIAIFQYGYFDLYIEQEYWTVIDYEISMEFYIYSYYSYWKNISYIVSISNDSHTWILQEEVSILIAPYDTFIFGLNWTFAVSGNYEVNFTIIDYNENLIWFEECHWCVEEPYWEIWLEHTYTLVINQEAQISIFAQNWYNEYREIGVTLLIYDEEDILYDTISLGNQTIEAFNNYYHGLVYTFLDVGYYSFELIVIDVTTSTEYTYDSYCEVLWGWHYIEIYQDYYGIVYEIMQVSIFVYNQYNTTRDVQITVNIYGPIDYLAYYDEVQTIENGTAYLVTLMLNFTLAGYYDIEVIAYDIELDEQWSEWCWFHIEAYEYYDIWIIQDYEAFVDETVDLAFFVWNKYTVAREVNIVIGVWCYVDFTFTVIWESNVTITADYYWYLMLNYTFTMEGYYEVVLILEDVLTAEIYEEYCYWYIYEGKIEIELYTWYYHLIYTDVDIEFTIINLYSYNVEVEYTFMIQNSTGHIIYMEVAIESINAGDYFGKNVFYNFTATGFYEVTIWVIELDTAKTWMDYSWVKIFEDGYFVPNVEESVTYTNIGVMNYWTLYVHNFYGEVRDVTIKIYIWDFANDTTIEVESIDTQIGIDGTFFFYYNYTFYTLGYYEVIFEITDILSGDSFETYAGVFVDIETIPEFNLGPIFAIVLLAIPFSLPLLRRKN